MIPDLLDGRCIHDPAFWAVNCEDCVLIVQKFAEAQQDAYDKCEWMRSCKDDAYLERTKVVAALAKFAQNMNCKVGIGRTDIPDWSPDWHNIIYINLPTGQISWHYNDAYADLFKDFPPYEGEWDGHDTDEKYRRLEALGGFFDKIRNG